MFLTQSVRNQGIPFIPTMDIPNARLFNALEEAEAIEQGLIEAKRYKSFEEVIKDID